MRIWRKLFAAAVAPLTLTGCLWGPGKFTSNLALNKAGTFVLDYQGEIMIQIPDDKRLLRDRGTTIWPFAMSMEAPRSKRARSPLCWNRHRSRDRIRRMAEAKYVRAQRLRLAKLKAEYEKRAAEKRTEQAREADQMAKLFGLPGSDDDSNRRFAANADEISRLAVGHLQGEGAVRRRLSFRRPADPGLRLSDDARQRHADPVHHASPAERRIGAWSPPRR